MVRPTHRPRNPLNALRLAPRSLDAVSLWAATTPIVAVTNPVTTDQNSSCIVTSLVSGMACFGPTKKVRHPVPKRVTERSWHEGCARSRSDSAANHYGVRRGCLHRLVRLVQMLHTLKMSQSRPTDKPNATRSSRRLCSVAPPASPSGLGRSESSAGPLLPACLNYWSGPNDPKLSHADRRAAPLAR
jgi:hypothetical protein